MFKWIKEKIFGKKNKIENQNILYLRPKVWKFEIDPQNIISFLSFHKGPIWIFSVLFFIIILSTSSFKIVASVQNFYSSSCLGGWSNVNLAEGENDVKEGDFKSFSKENSAILENSFSEMICGKFLGNTPDDSEPINFSVKFSILIDHNLESFDLDKKEDIFDSDDKISLFNKIFRGHIVLAQEESEDSFVLDQEEIFVESESVNDVNEDLTPSENEIENNIIESNKIENEEEREKFQEEGSDIREISSGLDYLEIFYTKDGSDWKRLGVINENNWQSINFSLPERDFSNWSDLTSLQIKILPIVSFDSLPTIFLDSTWIEVQYKNISNDLPKVLVEDSEGIILGEDFFDLNSEPNFILEKVSFSEEEILDLVKKRKAKVIEVGDNDVLKEFKEEEDLSNIKNEFIDNLEEVTSDTISPLLKILKKDKLKKNKINKDEPVTENEAKEKETLNQEEIEIIKLPEVDFSEIIEVGNLFLMKSFSPRKALAYSKPKINISVFNAFGKKIDIFSKIENLEEDGQEKKEIKLKNLQRTFSPGKYKILIQIKSIDSVVEIERNFTWGNLAINVDRSIVKLNETVYLQMATLNDYGRTICDANLRLIVRKPNGQIQTFETSNENSFEDSFVKIIRSKECGPNNYVEGPDYFLHYIPKIEGIFELELQNLDRGEKMTTTFSVEEDPLFDVQRISTSRTNPFLEENYFMNFKIRPKNYFSGYIREIVPADFEIIENSDYQIKKLSNGSTEITWHKTIAPNELIEINYEYDPPNISPFIFLHGPLSFFEGEQEVFLFKESRQWQVASDAACASAGTGNWNDSTKWTNCGGTTPQPGDTVSIGSGHTITLNTDADIASISIAGTLTNDSNARTLTLTGTSGTLFTRTGTFTPSTYIEVIIASTSGTPTLLSAGTTFYKLTIDSDATVINTGAFAVTIANSSGSKLYVKKGVFNASGATISGPGTGNGTLQIDSGATLCLGGTVASTNATCNSGTSETTARPMPSFQTYTFASDSTVSYGSDAVVTVSSAPTYGNLVFRPVLSSSRSWTIGTTGTPLNIAGNLDSVPCSSSTTARAITATLASNTTVTGSITLRGANSGGGCGSGNGTTTLNTSATSSYSLTASRITISNSPANSTLSANNSKITLTGTSGTLFTRQGTFTVGTSEVIVASSSGPVTLLSNATTFFKLTIDAPGVDVIQGSVAVTITSNASAKFYIKNGTFDNNGVTTVGGALATMQMDSGTNLKLGASETASVFPSNFTNANISLNSNSTVIFQGGLNSTISGVPTYGNVELNPLANSPFYAIDAATTINGNLNVKGTVTFVTVGFQITGPGSGSGTFTLESGATFCLSNGASTSCSTSSTTAVTMPVFQTYSFASGSTVKYMGNIAMTIASAPIYGNLVFAPVMTSTPIVYTAGGNINIQNNLRMYATGASSRVNIFNLAGTLDVGDTVDLQPGANSTTVQLDTTNNNYTLKTNKIILGVNNTGRIGNLIANNSIIELYGTTGSLFSRNSTNGIFTQGTSEVIIKSSSGSPTIVGDGSLTFHKLTIDSNATVINTGNSISINNVSDAELYIKNGVLNATHTITGPGSGNGNLQIDSGATLCLGGTSNATNDTCNSGATSTSAINMPTFQTYTFNTDSTVIYLSNTTLTPSVTPEYGNLYFNPVLTSDRVYTLGSTRFKKDMVIQPSTSSGSPRLTVTMNSSSGYYHPTSSSYKDTSLTIDGTSGALSTLNVSSNSINLDLFIGRLIIGSGGTLTFPSGGSGYRDLRLYANSGILFINNGTFNAGESIVSFKTNDGSSVTAISGDTVFDNIYFNPEDITGGTTIFNFGSSTVSASSLLIQGVSSTSGQTVLLNLGSSNFSVSGLTTISGSSANSNVNAILDTRPSGTDYNFNTGSLSILSPNGTGTLDASSSSSNITLTATSGTLLTRTGLFLAGNSTVITSGNGSAIFNSNDFTGSNAFYKLISSGTGTKTLGANIEIADEFSISNGTFSTSGSHYSINAKDIDIGALGILVANNSALTISRNWTNSGTFTAGGSTVTLNSGNTAIISGTTNFNNLTITHTSAKEVNFPTSTITEVSGAFNVTGNTGQLIKLWSITNDVKWKFKPTGTAIVSYADVKDGGCESGSIDINTPNSLNSGNNDFCWKFGITPTLSFSLGSNLVDLGLLSSSSTSTASHTFSASSNAPEGFIVFVKGTTLSTDFGPTISAIGASATSSSVGVEQFGLNLRGNSSPSVGQDVVVNSGSCGYGNGFDTINNFKFEENVSNILTNISAPADCEYTVSYISNINSLTEAGKYSTVLTYTITGTF